MEPEIDSAKVIFLQNQVDELVTEIKKNGKKFEELHVETQNLKSELEGKEKKVEELEGQIITLQIQDLRNDQQNPTSSKRQRFSELDADLTTIKIGN